MCGISVAISSKNNKILPEEIKLMNDSIEHRGPDDHGYYFGNNFAFGHRRLSILDLSIAGHQPMQRDGLVIVYNGEIYNYLELKEELKTVGHIFTTGTDTEVILAAYKEWGVNAFVKFNGMWAFALYDISKKEIIFCRDHFGIKPLYFTQTDNYFLAGSEIKQFLTYKEFKPVLNYGPTVNFLAHGWLNYSDETFFKGVYELKPGHYLKYQLSNHSYTICEWYSLDKAAKRLEISEKEAIQQFRQLFHNSVKVRMRSDVQVGSCLSGGLDSSAIVTAVNSASLANNDFSTITSCYVDKKYDEQFFSDAVTKETGFNSIKVFPDLNDLLDSGHMDKMIYHQDQPFSTASHYSEFSVFKTAREQNIIVMLDGQGSDEYLCGYGEFFVARMRELVSKGEWGNAIKMLRVRASQKGTKLNYELKKFLLSAYGYPILTYVKKILGRSNYPWLSDHWKTIAKKNIINFKSSDIRTLSIEEIVHSSIPYQLHSEDRNSMMFSIESRLPFLCPRLVEFTIGLPSEYKIKEEYTKYILREAIVELPKIVKERKDKMGFVAPDAPWMIKNSATVRKELEEIVAASSIFSPQLLKRFDDFVSGKLGYEPIYFRAMTLNRFLKIFKMQL